MEELAWRGGERLGRAFDHQVLVLVVDPLVRRHGTHGFLDRTLRRRMTRARFTDHNRGAGVNLIRHGVRGGWFSSLRRIGARRSECYQINDRFLVLVRAGQHPSAFIHRYQEALKWQIPTSETGLPRWKPRGNCRRSAARTATKKSAGAARTYRARPNRPPPPSTISPGTPAGIARARTTSRAA